jgi:hypothetical protein
MQFRCVVEKVEVGRAEAEVKLVGLRKPMDFLSGAPF